MTNLSPADVFLTVTIMSAVFLTFLTVVAVFALIGLL